MEHRNICIGRLWINSVLLNIWLRFERARSFDRTLVHYRYPRAVKEALMCPRFIPENLRKSHQNESNGNVLVHWTRPRPVKNVVTNLWFKWKLRRKAPCWFHLLFPGMVNAPSVIKKIHSVNGPRATHDLYVFFKKMFDPAVRRKRDRGKRRLSRVPITIYKYYYRVRFRVASPFSPNKLTISAAVKYQTAVRMNYVCCRASQKK